MKPTGIHPSVRVDAAGRGVVSHPGGRLLVETARASGLDRLLTEALRKLHEEVLARRRIYLGTDHPYTLRSAAYLANVLRALNETRAACELAEDTLERRRRILGDDHPHTMQSARELAGDLRTLGKDDTAQRIEDDLLLGER